MFPHVFGMMRRPAGGDVVVLCALTHHANTCCRDLIQEVRKLHLATPINVRHAWHREHSSTALKQGCPAYDLVLDHFRIIDVFLGAKSEN